MTLQIHARVLELKTASHDFSKFTVAAPRHQLPSAKHLSPNHETKVRTKL